MNWKELADQIAENRAELERLALEHRTEIEVLRREVRDVTVKLTIAYRKIAALKRLALAQARMAVEA